MTDPDPSPPPAPPAPAPAASAPAAAAAAPAPVAPPGAAQRGGRAGWWIAIAIVALGGGLWYLDHRRDAAARVAEIEADQRLRATESRLDGLRRDVRGHGQRLQQADATNRVLRDELLGLGQRAALLEQQVTRLADADRKGAQALRLDETELLLTLGEQRLRLAGDLDGARHAYALAADVLDGIDTPGTLNAKQALAQERAALAALDGDPARRAMVQLDAFARALPDDPATPALAPAAGGAPWWERVLATLVQVRHDDAQVALSAEDRTAARTALELELALARSAIDRRDPAGYRAALGRADAWLPRLWPPSPTLDARRAALKRLQALPLTLDLPTLGSTRQVLRAQRGG
ncbi:MAG: uroporphyrinogen-III C-methyltransferase [Xanthomonadales bacterium]|nr:uroporphyrinogen-III C-methyltransferase [Xanthomonadales bacterium]